MDKLPRWATQLMERHPGAEIPTREHPIPDWLGQEAARRPLWYTIREASEVRTEHPFLLHDEIHKQPRQWTDIVEHYAERVDRLADDLHAKGIDRIIFTGCGSAFFTDIHGAFVFERLAGLRTDAVESYELVHYFPPADPARTLVVGHSGTGGSIETVQAMQAADERGFATLAITNTEDTPVTRASQQSLTYVTSQGTGPCTSVISTRVLLQTMLAVALGRRRGVDDDLLDPVAEALPEAAAAGRDFLEQQEGTIRDLALRYADATSWMLVGSGPHYYSAREGVLKIEEQAILVAKAYRTGDFHHDALSVLAPERPVVAIEAEGAANERVVDALRAAREAHAPTIAVTWSGGSTARELAAHADVSIPVGPASELVSVVPMTVVFQLLGYHLGVARGFNPDTLRTDHEPNARAWLTAFPLGTH